MNHKNKLFKAIYELNDLLEQRENLEKYYQEFFERNPVAFTVLGYDTFQSYEKKSSGKLAYDDERKYKPEPDFLCGNIDSAVVTIFELKTPFVSKAVLGQKNRESFNSKLNSYLSQSEEYIDSIQGNPESRKNVIESLGLKSPISSYRICLVYGMSIDTSVSKAMKLANRNKNVTEILFYDQVLKRLIDEYSIDLDRSDDQRGWSIYCCINIESHQDFKKSYILDHGGEESNRVSIYIERGLLILEILDSKGFSHTLMSDIPYNEICFINAEFTGNGEDLYMFLNINNREMDKRLSNREFNFTFDRKYQFLGSNLKGESGAAFIAYDLQYYDKILKIKDKVKLCKWYIDQNYGKGGLRFLRDSYFMREPSTNKFIQPNPIKQPKLL